MLSKVFSAAAATAIAASFAFGASAATCTSAEAMGVKPNAGCEVGSTNNDKLNVGDDKELQVNIDQLFGMDDWVFLAKDDFGDGGPNGTDEGDASLLTASGSTTAGSFSIAQSVFDAYKSVLVVLKGGQGKTTQENYIGYLVVDSDTNAFAYMSPFFNPKNQNPKGISHISLYGSGEMSPIPLPAAGWMLLAGLGGLAAARRRKN